MSVCHAVWSAVQDLHIVDRGAVLHIHVKPTTTQPDDGFLRLHKTNVFDFLPVCFHYIVPALLPAVRGTAGLLFRRRPPLISLF